MGGGCGAVGGGCKIVVEDDGVVGVRRLIRGEVVVGNEVVVGCWRTMEVGGLAGLQGSLPPTHICSATR